MDSEQEGGVEPGPGLWAGTRVVATVTTEDDLSWLEQNSIEAEADYLEFRLDDLAPFLDRAREVAGRIKTPRVLTARHPGEGGKGDLSEERRLELLKQFYRAGDLVDLELRTLRVSEPARELSHRVQQEGGLVIASHHDFDGLPDRGELDEKLGESEAWNADLLKLAVTLSTWEDLVTFTGWVRSVEAPVAAMGMGPFGKLSRLVLGNGISCLTYGYLQHPNAPGQWRAREVRHLLKELAT